MIVLHKSIDFQPFPSHLTMPSFSWLFILETWMLSFTVPSPLTLIPKSYWFYAAAAVTSVTFNSLWPHGLSPTLLCPWNSPGKNTGVGSHSLPQGIFPTQGSNLGLLHCRPILDCLSHQRSTKNVMWYTFCDLMGCSLSGSSVHRVFQARILERVAKLEIISQ